jgi:hypothetical protein
MHYNFPMPVGRDLRGTACRDGPPVCMRRRGKFIGLNLFIFPHAGVLGAINPPCVGKLQAEPPTL